MNIKRGNLFYFTGLNCTSDTDVPFLVGFSLKTDLINVQNFTPTGL